MISRKQRLQYVKPPCKKGYIWNGVECVLTHAKKTFYKWRKKEKLSTYPLRARNKRIKS